MTPDYISPDNSIHLYQCDCMDFIKTMPRWGCMITDPPWGLGGGSGTIGLLRAKADYGSECFDDTLDNLLANVIPSINAAMALNPRALITPGAPHMWHYPKPVAVGGFYQPAAAGMCRWGFASFNPVLFYGKDPRDGKGQSGVMMQLTECASDNQHPCAKPLGAMKWMVNKGTLPNETVFDPFAGSGTTAIACIKTERKFIGCEIDPRWFDRAVERIEQAFADQALFVPPPVETQEEMFTEERE